MNLKSVAAVGRLQIEDVAPGHTQHAANRCGDELMQTVGEFDHDDGTLTRRTHKTANDRTRVRPEFVEYNVHAGNRSTRVLAVYNGHVARPVDSLYPVSPMAALWGEIRGPFDTAGPRGCVEVVCGSMFSGKTEELLRRVKRARLARLPLQLFKPKVDSRYDAVKVVSHAGAQAEALPVANAEELEALLDENTRVVGIDEVQFFDESIVAAVDRLADRGVRVICAGLDLDYRGLPFGSMPALLAIAEQVTKLQAVCSQCGSPATRSQRLVAREGQLFVGGAAEYEPRCRACFLPMAIVPTDGM